MRRSKMELCPVRGRILACTYHQSPPRCPKSQRAGVQGASRSSRGRYHNTTTTESETNANLASKVHFCRAASVSVNDTQCQLGSRVTIMWRTNKSELVTELRPAGGGISSHSRHAKWPMRGSTYQPWRCVLALSRREPGGEKEHLRSGPCVSIRQKLFSRFNQFF